MSSTSFTSPGFPRKQGLYDPRFEKDACGIGFVANIKGIRSHEIVRQGLEVLENLTHRGAQGCDPYTGDGAGILIQIPHEVFTKVCADVGISLGQSYYYYKKMYGRNIIPLKNVYIGTQSRYNLSTLMHKKTSYNEVAQLLSDGKVVALFQGRAEAGYRALGNRSLLMDPRISDGRDKLNKIKGREDFRPFAGTVLQEYANEWFDIEESEYMQYAAKVKKEGIPAMIHVDNTCRVQTVTKKQNKHFYNLIRSFYKLTDTPLLLNTSLNCAGETIAENFDQCISTSHRMKIPYIFLPEKMELVQLGK